MNETAADLLVGLGVKPKALSTARITTKTQAYTHLINRTARELEKLLQQMQELVRTDGLTRFPNRPYLMEWIHSHVRLHERDSSRLALLLLDLDDFKQVNDRCGHQTGDEVLVDLARIIESVIRLSDIPGRWGGEEFLVICPNTDANGTRNLAERQRAAEAEHTFSGICNSPSPSVAPNIIMARAWMPSSGAPIGNST